MWYNYFKSERDYFWRWADNFEATETATGATIAYKAYLSDVITQLAPQGLPPFGALLLAYIATNQNSSTEILAIYKNKKVNSPSIFSNNKLSFLRDAFQFLVNLSKVPAIYKTGDKRILLFKALFLNCHGILSLQVSDQIAKAFRQVGSEFSPGHFTSRFVSEELTDFRVFQVLNNQNKSVKDIIKLISQIPEIGEEFKVEKSFGELEKPKDFAEVLIENGETFRIGVLLKFLWAGLPVSFNHTLPNQQPIGGVADLTNKGNIEQLLISEFANSDLVFLSRLVNQEALYLSREKPPLNNEVKRVIIIDVSLKNWGTPKTLSFATLLAFTKHPKNKMDYEIYAIGNNFKPLHLETIHQVNEAVQIVDVHLNAAKGLQALIEKLAIETGLEIFLLTSKDALQEAAMQKIIAENSQLINYCITHQVNGAIDVYHYKNKKRKHLQHLQLPIERLWKRKQKQIVNTNVYQPAFYPILFRIPSNYLGIRIANNNQLFIITKEKNLLSSRIKNQETFYRGYDLIYENLPLGGNKNSVCEIAVLSNDEVILLIYNDKTEEIVLINIQENKIKRISFSQSNIKQEGQFAFQDERFFYFENGVEMWNIKIDGTIQTAGILKKTEPLNKNFSLSKDNFLSTCSILKNVKEVGINSNYNLVFNKHELRFTQQNKIILSHSKCINFVNAFAKQVCDNCFEFNDGSQVIINPVGVFILKSSEQFIPAIFIPSVLDSSLGIATYTYFTGNPFYLNDPLYVLNRNKIIKSATENVTFQHQEKSVLIGKPRDPKLFSSRYEKLKIFSVNKFFRIYIKPFINTIVEYET